MQEYVLKNTAKLGAVIKVPLKRMNEKPLASPGH